MQVAPDGEFADYYGKSLSAAEMLDRVSTLISGWESQLWWDNVLGRAPPPRARRGATAEELEERRSKAAAA